MIYDNTGPSQTQVGTGRQAESQGLVNLLQMLQTQGRVDPRLLASLQAANARGTQQQQDAIRSRSAAGGMARGGLAQALMASVGAAGADRASNLTYQDIADSYRRNQENVGLMNQVVQQPALGYSTLQEGQNQFRISEGNKSRAANAAMVAGIVGGIGKMGAGGA